MDQPAGDDDGALDEPAAEPDVGGWGVADDPTLATPLGEAGDGEPSLVAGLLALVDDAASRVLDHPVRPRIKASPGGLVRGELDVAQIEVPAVLAAGLVIDRLVVRAEHLRVAPGLPPRLQAHPLSMRAYVSQHNVDRWVHAAHLPITLRLTEEGVRLTTGLGGIRMSETLADLEVAGRFLRLSPKRMTIVGLPAPLARFFRGYLPLPPLPRGARLTEVRHDDGALAVTFALERLDEPLTPEVARRLARLTKLPIPGLT